MSKTVKSTTKAAKASPPSPLLFGKVNYQLMGASIFVIALGFILMIGDSDIYSFTKITLSPLVVVAGFVLGFVAILKKPNA